MIILLKKKLRPREVKWLFQRDAVIGSSSLTPSLLHTSIICISVILCSVMITYYNSNYSYVLIYLVIQSTLLQVTTHQALSEQFGCRCEQGHCALEAQMPLKQRTDWRPLTKILIKFGGKIIDEFQFPLGHNSIFSKSSEMNLDNIGFQGKKFLMERRENFLKQVIGKMPHTHTHTL